MASYNSTPTKEYTNVQYTPTSKKRLCVLYSKREENDNYRVRLFKNEKKSEACDLVEKLLLIEISPLLHVDSLCRNCHRSLTLKTKVLYHKGNSEKTIETLKKTHGKISKKRLPFENVWPVRDNKEGKTGHDFSVSVAETMEMDNDENKETKVTFLKCRQKCKYRNRVNEDQTFPTGVF